MGLFNPLKTSLEYTRDSAYGKFVLLYCIVLYLFITKLFEDYKLWQWTNDIDDEHLIIGANK